MEGGAEAVLYSISRLAVLSGQLAGYLPLSLISPKTPSKASSFAAPKNLLHFRFFSLPLLWNLISLVFFSTSFFLYTFYFRPQIRVMRVLHQTETFMYNLKTTAATFIGLALRVYSLVRWRSTVSFFEDHVLLIRKFLKQKIPLESALKSQVSTYLALSLLLSFFPLLIHISSVHFYFPVFVERPKGFMWTVDIIYSVESGVWVFFACLLISNAWILLYPSIYIVCYRQLAAEIQKRHSQLSYLNEMTLTSSRKDPQGRTATLEDQVRSYLELIFDLGQMVDSFNAQFGHFLVGESILCLVDLVMQFFFGAFFFSRGYLRIIFEIASPLYLNGKKLLELGNICGNVRLEAQRSVKTLVHFIPLHRLSRSLRTKVQLLQIQMETNPPTISASKYFLINNNNVIKTLNGIMGFLFALVQFGVADRK